MGFCDFIELGSGSFIKIWILLDVFVEENIVLCYIFVDISEVILRENVEVILVIYFYLMV